MAMWNKVVSGFDRDEETVNFGARATVEKDGTLFETSTIATIETDGVVSDEPRIFASVQYSRVCVAIDKSITIFEDETCEAILLNANFDSLISCYCISEDGFFLFIVLAIGSLHCLHLSNGGKVIFSKNIVHPNDTVTRIFAHVEERDSIIVTFVTKNGTIHRVSGLDKAKAESLLNANDDTVLREAGDSIRCTEIFNGFTNDEVIYANGKIVKGKLTIAMVCSNSLFTWPSKCHTTFEGLQYKYKKVKFLKIYDAMLCLRTDNMLNVVCQHTLLGRKVYSEAVYDFTVMGGETNEPCQIIILSKSKTELTYTLRVVSFPGLTEKFQITVPGLIHLIDITDYYSEGVLFIECGKRDGKIDPSGIDTVRIKAISKSVPEYKLQRLVRRGLFDAAEDFAQKYKLSIESIYCAKTILLMSSFDPWGPQKSNSIDLDTFIEVLDKIASVQFVAECCSKVLIAEYTRMRKLYLYARKRIIANAEKIKSNEYLSLLYSINTMLHKLETFHIIWGYQSKTDIYDEKTLKEWIRFSRADLMEEYKTHLRMGEMEAATLIWTRHLSGADPKISLKVVQEIFATVPKEITPSALWPWMSHFVPALLRIIPDGISEVIFWGYGKIKSLEQTHRRQWPQIGIDFVDMFIKLLHLQKNNPSSSIHQEYSSQNSALKQFTRLMQALSDIRKLKMNYRLTVSLDAYSGEPKEVCHILLDRICISAIPEFVKEFLNQYMLNTSLQSDVVFSSYIKKLTRHSKSWWSSDEAPWEKRAVAVISLIHDIGTKLQQTLDVLRKAPVPWSATMTALAEASSKIDHDLTSNIRIECDYVPIKLILKRYGYESIGINYKLIRRVIKENDDDMIAHIDQLTNDQTTKQNAFASCITYHLSAGNLKVAMKVLHNLDDETLSFCCLSIVNYVSACMSLKSSKIESAIHCAELFGWVTCRIEEMIEKYKNNMDRIDVCRHIISSISIIEPRFLIWKEFDINLDTEEFLLKKDQILANYAETLCGDTEKDYDLDAICKSLFRMADLLKLNRLTVISLLIKQTKNAVVLDYFKTDEGKINFTPDETKYVNEICFSTFQHTKVDANAARKIKHLSATALCASPAGQCNDSLLPYFAANLYYETFGQQSTMVLDQTREHSRPNVNWNLYPIYKDLAITTDHVILPILQETLILRKTQIDSLRLTNGEKKMTVVSQSQHAQMMRNLLDKIQSIKIEHNDYCLLKIIKSLYYGYCALSNANTDLLIRIETMLTQLSKTLLRKVISARKFDLQLALSCLFMLPVSDACKWILAADKSFLMDHKRHLTISVLGYEYFRLTKNKQFVQTFGYYKMLHSWAQRLSKYSVPYKDIMTSSSNDRRRVLQQLMNCNVEKMIPIFEDFCIDFGFTVTDCYLLYLQTILKAWNPTLNFVTSCGKKELKIPEEEVYEIRQQCNILAGHISDKVALKNCIKSIWAEINFYYYELFVILMDLCEDKNPQSRNYICFLQNYTRVGPSTRVECDEWMHIYPGHTSLPPIAQWRLPFLPKIELWTLIKSELNLETYEKWLSIAPVLKLQSHLICTLAVKGEMNRVWGKHSTRPASEEWTLSSRNSTLLTGIKKCIEQMSEPNALYYCVVALYYVVNHTPPGADLVAAAEECYKYAQISAQQSVKLEEGMLEKIKMKYLRFKSEHILRTHGLGVSRYLALIENPEKLVRQLYTDESIPHRFRTVTDHRPDINTAVNVLSELFDINLIKLRLTLLQEWLQPNTRCVKIDQTFTDVFPIGTNTEQTLNYDDNLLRACYMLEHGDIVQSANYLINIGFGDNNEDYNFGTRYRALQVLQTILDVNALEDFTKRNLSTFRQYMNSLKYISMLEAFGLIYGIDTFESCCKRELVQILWKTQYHSPQALVLIAHICMDFEIYEYSLWDKNLSRMAKLSMTTELKEILLHLRNISVIVNSNGYLVGWEVVLTRPFKAMDMRPTSEQIEDCIEALGLLHSCPILYALEFTDIISSCFQCQQPHFAAALLPFLNQTDTQYVLQMIKNEFEMSEVLENLDNLSLHGVLLISQCRGIIQETTRKDTNGTVLI